MREDDQIGVWYELTRFRMPDGVVHASFIMLLDRHEGNARFKMCSMFDRDRYDDDAVNVVKDVPLTCFQCLTNLGG